LIVNRDACPSRNLISAIYGLIAVSVAAKALASFVHPKLATVGSRTGAGSHEDLLSDSALGSHILSA
jgi:hypothetical protein